MATSSKRLKRDHELRDELYSKPVQLLKGFDQVEAVGLSGSVSRGVRDELSDIDLCVFVVDQLPTPIERQRHYKASGISEFKYFDGDLDVSRIDGLQIDNTDYDFLWMSLPEIQKLLHDTVVDFDCDEYLVGGLLTTQSVFDPNGQIARLRHLIPRYSEERAQHRVKINIERAHSSIYALEWMTKAAHRNDAFSYFFNKWTVFDYFVNALFALNRRWRADEKRIVQQIREFEFAPENAADRVESIILFRDTNSSLVTDAKNIRELFADFVNVAENEFPNIDLPNQWD